MNETIKTTQSTIMHVELMKRAIETCRKGIAADQSPFAAVIATQEGEVVCAVHNTVRANGDVTAHAEITAIREACRILNTINLIHHFMVTTCEPCPMCASAIHWAKMDAVVYGSAIEDAQKAMFNELTVPTQSLYDQGGSHVKVYPFVCRDECNLLFDEWRKGPNPKPY